MLRVLHFPSHRVLSYRATNASPLTLRSPFRQIFASTGMSEAEATGAGLKRSVDEDPSSSKRVRIESENATPEDTPVPDAKDVEPEAKEGVEPDGGNEKGKKGGKAKGKQGKDKKAKPKGKGRRRGTRQDGSGDEGESGPKTPRLPKRQCALLIGFCGTGCNGMQIQPNVRTIEGVLFDALVKAGAVSQDNADDPVKVNLGRAARTDAGVHAAGNVVSMKLITEVPGVSDLKGRINELLPPEIRLWSILRVQNSFSARTFCDSRKYTYTFPSYVLLPPKPGSGLHKTFNLNPSGESAEPAVHPLWSSSLQEPTSREEDLEWKRRWRVDPERLQVLRDIAQRFEGSHNFHNFTVGRDFSDRSTQRFMKKVEIPDPVVHGNTEWISVLWHGQSFMLHQVRKMMSVMVLACRTGTPPQIIDELYGPRTVFVPKMPSLGLLLEYPIFDGYNRRVAPVNQGHQPGDAEYRPPIDFEVHRAEIDAFKQEFIYKGIREIEGSDGVFDAWVRHIDSYAGGDLGYFNPKGVIPSTAVLKKGERRENPFREKKRFDATGKADKLIKEEEEEEASEEETLDKAKLADMEG
ncbi:pseudouridine synthase [Gloeophyllum trabeum ATCC 11539]|uniref:Pseudouridine synthase n=1 Tax=Gloeophyllum trabeum (strain ATCC 11539 / FP-39264 / Madison 617) TaxID=670483 RepID=S7RPN9_GLOTA|nr:pseudouridine synthase [Gloeophyllum trabeum ATCC 11539]EPQ56520.1 pseudouridine synthase [Gloeophyllum trabeum ATCC 11539]